MATYIQGVKDYIPQFQPFQPDLNLYANVLQTKQTQYDSAYKSLNNLYGQYFYSELSRDTNIERKEEILKNVDFNLKRVAGLDLSLDQNIQQAVQVFKPFYEDQYIMKDMAWTKNYSGQKGRAEGLKNSQDEETRSQYWDTGVKELDYRREEFRSLSDDESLSFGNVGYTPYVNVQERALKIAKDAGLSVESVDFSPDQRWIIKTKNGEQLMEPLSKLFEATLGSDPGVQAVYKTQAYVNRKDYAYSNAAQFGGDQSAAEMKYLENGYNILKEQNQQRYNALKQQSVSYDSKIADIEKQIKNGNATPYARQSLAQYQEAKRVNDAVLNRVDSENKMLNEDRNGTANTEAFRNPYGDIQSLRWKVDNGMASLLMQKDLDEAAQVYAYRDQSIDVDANPYAVNEQRFQQDIALANLRGSYMLKATELRNRGEKENNIDKYLYDRGTHVPDTNRYLPDGSPNPNYGRAIPLEVFDHVTTEGEDEASGGVNMKVMDQQISKANTQQIAAPYFNNMLTVVDQLISENQMSKEEAKQILGMDYLKFNNKLQNNSEWFLRRELGPDELAKINKRFKNWTTQNKDLSGLNTAGFQQLIQSSTAFDDYTQYVKASQDWRKKTAKQVESELIKKGYNHAYLLYDNKGNLRSEEEFYKVLPENTKNRISKAVFNELMMPGVGARIEDAYEIIKTFAKIGWENVTNDLIGIGKVLKTYGLDRDKRFQDRIRNAANEAGGYNGLVTEAAKVYSTNTAVKDPVVGMDKFANMTGAGTFTTGRSTIVVNPKAQDTASFYRYNDIMRDLAKFDFKTDKASIRGINVDAKETLGKESEKSQLSNRIAESILSEIQSEIGNPYKTKMGNFKVQVSPIAFGTPNKAAIVIRPDAEWLKTLVYTQGKEGEKKSAGMISADQYDMIMKNGIAYVMNANQMTNSVYRSSFQSPLQSIIDYNGSYQYTDPINPDRNVVYTKNPINQEDYKAEISFPFPDMEGNVRKQTVVDNVTGFGNNLESHRSTMIDYFRTNQEALRTPLTQ